MLDRLWKFFIPKTKMAIGRTLYNVFFRRTSTFAATIFVGAFCFERMFDPVMDGIWEKLNRGVCTFVIHRLVSKLIFEKLRNQNNLAPPFAFFNSA